MDQKSGGRNAGQPGSQNGSSNRTLAITPTEADAALGNNSPSIDDMIAMHLADCAECRRAIETLKPAGLGQRTGLCNQYLQLQLMRAQIEGAANNIVAYTEYGDEAPKGGSLE